MNIFHLVRGQPPQVLSAPAAMPADGYLWIDVVRDGSEDWAAWPQRLLGAGLDRRHVADSRDPVHKAFFDLTPDYDFLVCEEVVTDPAPRLPATVSVALFVFERLLISVRAADNTAAAVLHQRFADGSLRAPGSARVLAQVMLDVTVERLLAAEAAFGLRMDDLQESLLDPRNPFDDWQQLLAGRREARRLEYLCDGQIHALEAWHRGSTREWSNPEETRLRDILEHIARGRHGAADLERHIEAAVQLYFTSLAYRTNEVVRLLTVFSAIFLPLTFLAGVYGMNFRQMPELSLAFGYPALLAVMLVVASGLLVYFRRRGFW